jgi:hypothetical protein
MVPTNFDDDKDFVPINHKTPNSKGISNQQTIYTTKIDPNDP